MSPKGSLLDHVTQWSHLHVVKPLRSIRLLQVTMSSPHHISSPLLPTTGQHVVKTLRIIPIPQVTMTPPRHIYISTTTYYRSTGQHQYYRSPCHHLAMYIVPYYYLLKVYRSTRRQNPQKHTITTITMSPPQHILYSYLLHVYRSTRRQNPQKHTSTTGHHVTTSPYILFPTTTYYRSAGQHVVKTLRTTPALQVTMSPPLIISYTLLTLLPTTCLHVNTSSKPSNSKDYRRSPCHHLATSILLYYYLLQVHRSTRRQNPQNHTLLQVNMSPPRHISPFLPLPTTGLQVNTSSKPLKHTITTGHHVTTSPYMLLSTTIYYRSTGQHVVKTLRSIPGLQVTMSPPHYIYYSLLLPSTGLQVNMSSKPHESYPTTSHHVPILPHLLFSTTTNYMSTGQHTVKTLRTIPLQQVTMSPPRIISYPLLTLLPTTCLHVNTSSKPSDS